MPNNTTTTTTTTTNDDMMTLSSYATIINETLPHNPELQLCIHDLVHPTETAETLLETLSTEQLNIIEQAVNKIKERKLNPTKDQGNKKIKKKRKPSYIYNMIRNTRMFLSF